LSCGVGAPQNGVFGVIEDEISIISGNETVWGGSEVSSVGVPVYSSVVDVRQNDVSVSLDGEFGLTRGSDQGVGGRGYGAGARDIGLRDKGVSEISSTREVINEDGVLSTIQETILSRVDGGTLGVGWVSHVVALVVSPVHGLLDLVAHSGLVSPVGV